MRGSWEGGGTWRTSGPDFTGLIPAAVVVGVVAGVAVVVAEFILYIVAFAAVVLAGLAAAAVVYSRKSRARWDRLEATRPARHAAILGPDSVPVTEGTPPVIENHLHIHHHYAASREPLPAIPPESS
jgi:hypothetical protein